MIEEKQNRHRNRSPEGQNQAKKLGNHGQYTGMKDLHFRLFNRLLDIFLPKMVNLWSNCCD